MNISQLPKCWNTDPRFVFVCIAKNIMSEMQSEKKVRLRAFENLRTTLHTLDFTYSKNITNNRLEEQWQRSKVQLVTAGQQGVQLHCVGCFKSCASLLAKEETKC